MSYGPQFSTAPDDERGLYFMAYCGSIAEQFEVVQRWITGGNSSGVLAAHNDPFLGVPEKGVARSFQWLGTDGEVARVNLGDEPLTQLEWGLYLFVPSKAGLAELSKGPTELSKTQTPQPVQTRELPTSGSDAQTKAERKEAESKRKRDLSDLESKAFDELKGLLQDKDQRDRIWKRVNEVGGEVKTAYGLLVSDRTEALKIMKDSEAKYSVCGYGWRFKESVGEGYLGMDPPGHTKLAETSKVNERIAEITEERAFHAAREVTEKLLAARAPGLPGSGQETPVDIVELSEQALAGLCTTWFGLPNNTHMLTGTSAKPIVDLEADSPCCPRDFVYVARHIFGPHPSDSERDRGMKRGRAIERGVKAYLTSGAPLIELSKEIHEALAKHGNDVVAHTIAGVMLGFAPSVHGNYVNVMRAWVEHRSPDTPSLWDLQTYLLDVKLTGAPQDYKAIQEVLRPWLIKQMRKAPIPPAIWRERPGAAPEKGKEPEKIVIGLHGVMQDPEAPELMMFGGSLKGKLDEPTDLKTVHACPGYGMATGVLMGMISTLLLAGTLRTTPSPTILNVVR
jgi:hypothetical protein